jgi:hypothetical protein
MQEKTKKNKKGGKVKEGDLKPAKDAKGGGGGGTRGGGGGTLGGGGGTLGAGDRQTLGPLSNK